MIIYPAIDVKDGKCVRLAQGEFGKVTVYSDDPVEMALDGARYGEPQNISIISEMAVKLGIPIQLGGGIRTIEMIEIILCKGIERVILGTSAVNDPELVKKAIKAFGNNLAIAVDAKEGMVAIEGWAKTSQFKAIEFAKMMEEFGAKTIIYTDISKDGMLSGPNFEAIEEMVGSVGIDVVASGGVKSLDDIKRLKSIGVAGAVIGKAIYSGAIDLAEAIKIAAE
jgi:phosphoribosylformimino-5-aminoimidazole carboxamide ribotide isomerase